MAVKQEVVLEFNADTSDVQKSLSGLDKDFDKVGKSANDAAEEVEGLAEATEDAAKNTEDLGKNSKKAGSDMKTAGKTGATGFKLVGTALQATGLFTLVTKVLAPIIQAFTDNKKVAEALEVAFAALGTVINVIVDAAAPLGDLLIDIFTNPQQVITDLKDKLTDLFGSPKEALLNFANLLKENIINRFEGLFKLIPRLASAIGKLFEGDFSGAAKTAADAVGQVVLGVENVTDKVVEAASAAADFAAPFVNSAKEAIDASTLLTQKQQALRDAQRELNVATAEGAAEVEELKRQSDDQRLSTEERIEAATRAAEINQRFADENVAISQQRAQLLREEIALQGETAERLDELASAEIEAANAAQASSTIQTELQNKLFALNQEALAQQQEAIDKAKEEKDEKIAALQEFYDQAQQTISDAEEKTRATELAATAKKYKEQLALAEELGDDTSALLEAQRAEELGINEKYDDLTAESSQRAQQAKLDVAKQTLTALADLNEAFGGADLQRQEKIDDLKERASEATNEQERFRLEQQAFELAKLQDREGKKQFERGKKIQIAQTLISTYESAVQAFKSLAGIPVVGPSLGVAAASVATLSGLAAVKNIQKTKFEGSAIAPTPPSSQSPSSSIGGGQGVEATSTAPQLDLGFLGGGAEQTGPIQAFVLSENVSNAQQANQLIEDQATL